MIYEKIKDSFDEKFGRLLIGENQEWLGYNVDHTFKSITDVNKYRDTLPALYETLGRPKTFEQKQFQEEAHYGKLKYTLLHQIAESKFYMKEQVLKSRKFIVLSTDCISTVQIVFREDKIFCGVYFRSSHLTELLPVDTHFILGLIGDTVEYLEQRIDEPTFEDVKDSIEMIKNNPVEISYSFGSLHRY